MAASAKKPFMWLTDNEMMANAEKYHLLSSDEDHKIKINRFTVKNSHCEKLLGFNFNNQLKFDCHIKKKICKNANRKIHTLANVALTRICQRNKF